MIGVFDSGVGGLTVLKALADYFPYESFLYLGDAARLPYGTKSPETIRAYSEQIMNFLAAKKVKAIVIACNSASSQVPESEWQGIPVYNVIIPGSEFALSLTRNGKIGVLGTRATVESNIYFRTLRSLNPEVEIHSQSCPLLVPLAEEALLDDPITNLIAYRYVQPLMAYGIDTLILGCTHYPLLRESIQKACGNKVTLIDSGLSVSEKICRDFMKRVMIPEKPNERTITVLSTDLSSHTEAWARAILSPLHIAEISKVDL